MCQVELLHISYKGLKDPLILNLFEDDKYLRTTYVKKVLLWEAIIAILETVSGLNYQEAKRICLEIQAVTDLQAEKMALELAEERKNEQSKYRWMALLARRQIMQLDYVVNVACRVFQWQGTKNTWF